jgi:predicted AAA+ superfamily ATPase
LNLPTIFETCKPRADVKSGATKDEQFVADLTQVLRGMAPDEYCKPELFFKLTYPTRGLKELLKAVCLRLSGKGGEVASIIRLGTQYGGGKTHGLIALVHAVNGMKGVESASDFVDTAILPTGKVRIAALDGENSDPANGLTLEGDLRAFSFWGEMAYQLAGRTGYERVRNSDEKHIAPGTDTIRELFGTEPTLILMDEVSVYLRKVEKTFPGLSEQFTAFVHALFKAVSSSPNVALVYTLAVGSDDSVKDAYKEENERAAATMAEAEMVAARSSTNLNPTEEDDTANVLRARLFEKVDLELGQQVIDSYRKVWTANKETLPIDAISPELADQFSRSYPLHPKLLEMFKEKTASLSTFQRTRGMLRLLARTMHLLWTDQPADAYAIHIHHVDPGCERIRSEINVKLGLSDYAAAIKSDVAAVPGDEPALAQQMDQQKLPGLSPHCVLVAKHFPPHCDRDSEWHPVPASVSAPTELRVGCCSSLVPVDEGQEPQLFAVRFCGPSLPR